MTKPTLAIFKTNSDVELPTYATAGAACFDIKFQRGGATTYKGYDGNNNEFTRHFSDDKITIMPGERILVPTGLIFEIPEGYSIRAHIRSSVALKRGLMMANSEGIIDSDYFHQSYIMLYNASLNKQYIDHKERLAQFELVENCDFDVVEIEEAPIQTTERTGGFGSTGTN